MQTEQLTQALAIADVINQGSITNTNANSIGIDMSKYKRAIYVIQCGSLGTAGTLDGRLQSSANSNFNVVHNIANTNLTQITTSSTPGNNAVATIEIRSDEVVQANSGDRYVRLQLTGGGNAITVGAIGLGGESIHKPASAGNLNNTYLSQQNVSQA